MQDLQNPAKTSCRVLASELDARSAPYNAKWQLAARGRRCGRAATAGFLRISYEGV